MRKEQKRSPNETQGVLLRPLGESEKIDDAFLQMSNRLGRPLGQERMEQLQRDLANYPVAAIEYALDSWGRNAKVLPALADLLTLLTSYMSQHSTGRQTCGQCDSGWIRGFKDKAGNDAVKRCECCIV